MSSSVTIGATTFLDRLIEALETACDYNKQDQDPPAAVIWPDKDRQWEMLLPRLQERLPIFTLGPYAPDVRSGPAYWFRCIIARTIHSSLEEGEVPILYLPGYSRQDVRAIETCPRELQPIAELQYSGVLWTQNNGRDWTISAFLQNQDVGLGVDVAADTATKEALRRALMKLAEEPIEGLRREEPIRAPFLNGLLHTDEVKDILRWLDDPSGFKAASSPEEWAAFSAVCQSRYDFDPEQDGPITAARLLGQRSNAWDTAWRRFAEAPATYTAMPQLLRQARPEKTLPMLDPPESWPQDNEAAEASLRQALGHLATRDAVTARSDISALEEEHGYRRGWVWASLGQTPLANALEHLATLAKESEQPPAGSSISEVAAAYADGGWRSDLAVLDALAAVEKTEDLAAVRAALGTVYRPWLEAGAIALQKSVSESEPGHGYAATPAPEIPDGTCVLFSDGLRYDVAQRLRALLDESGMESSLDYGLAALPSVTGTAKPAVSPAAAAFNGGTSVGVDPVLAASGTTVGIGVLHKAIGDIGVQVLRGDELGDPTGRAWTELGAIDSYGHEHGWRVAHHLRSELPALARRINSLLEHGWERVVVVTDHGWLLLPGGLPKADLPEHLTEVRKGRCARLKEGSQTDQQVVPWHWDPSVRFAIAPGIHCYESGKEYEHGGLSPQECVVPILTLAKPVAEKSNIEIEPVAWRGLRCNIKVIGAASGLRADLRVRVGDASSSLSRGGREIGTDGAVALLVDDEDREGQAAVVVVVDADGSVRAQIATIVGGS